MRDTDSARLTRDLENHCEDFDIDFATAPELIARTAAPGNNILPRAGRSEG